MATKRLRNMVSQVYYKYGLFCSSHPTFMICLTILIAIICSAPLVNLPLPGYAPLEFSTPVKEYSLPLRKSQNRPTQPPTPSTPEASVESSTPNWFDGPPLAFIQQFNVKAVVSPWQSNLIRSDAFRAPLSKVFKLLNELNEFKYNNSLSIKSFCYYVMELLPKHQSKKVLPRHDCLMLSPALIWENQQEKFSSDGDLIQSIYKHQGTTIDYSPNLKDLLFGIPWKYSGISRFYMRNRQRVISYSVTVVLQSYNASFIDGVKTHLQHIYPDSLVNISQSQEEEMTHIFFQNEPGFVELTWLGLTYLILFMYVYFSVRKIEMVKSKWGLAFSAVAMVIASLLMSVGLCSFFGLTPTVREGEIFPYMVVFIGLENIWVLTKSVVSTPVHLDVKIRVAKGLSREGWYITKNLYTELMIICVGYFTFVPAIQEFCLFVIVGLITDFLLQMMFFVTVLSIDIRRLELSDLQKKSVQRELQAAQQDEEEAKTEAVSTPESKNSVQSSHLVRSKSSPGLSLWSDLPKSSHLQPTVSLLNPPTTQGTAPSPSPMPPAALPPPAVKMPKRLRLNFFWARYRVVSRIVMVASVIWILVTCFLVYKSGIVHQLTESKSNASSPSQLSNVQIANHRSPDPRPVVDSNLMGEPPTLISSAGRDDRSVKQRKKDKSAYTHPLELGSTKDWWRMLSYRHWPTLFNCYNISLSNRYISMLPPIQLSFIIDPEEAIAMRHAKEINQANRYQATMTPYVPNKDEQYMITSQEEIDDDEQEEEDEDNDITDWKILIDSPPVPLFKATRWDFWFTIVLAMMSAAFFIIMLVVTYKCVSGRNHGKTGSFRYLQSRAESYVRKIAETAPTVLKGHIQEVECLVSDGAVIVSSCLGGEIRVWDPKTGECVTAINRAGYRDLCSIRYRKPHYGNGKSNDRMVSQRGLPSPGMVRSPSTSSSSSGIHDMEHKPRSLSDPSKLCAVSGNQRKLFEDQPCLRSAIDTGFCETSAKGEEEKRVKTHRSTGSDDLRNCGYDFDSKFSSFYEGHRAAAGAAGDGYSFEEFRKHSKSVDSYFMLQSLGKTSTLPSGIQSPGAASQRSLENAVSMESLGLGESPPDEELFTPHQLSYEDSFGHCGDMPNVLAPPIWCLGCHDNVVVAGCGNGRVEVWDAVNGLLLNVYHDESKAGVTALVITSNRIVTARLNGYVDFIDISGNGMYSPTSPHGSFQYQTAYSRHVSTSEGLYSGILQCHLLRCVKAHQQPINGLKAAGGRVVTASQDHTLKVFRLEDALCLYTLHGHTSSVTALKLDESVHLAALSGGGDGSVRLWDLLTGHVNTTFGHSGPVNSLACTAAYVISIGLDDRLCVWERRHGSLLNVIHQESGFSNSVAMLSHDLLISGGQGCLILWDAINGVKLRKVKLGSRDQTVQQVSSIDYSAVLCDFGTELRVVNFPIVMQRARED
ncbi:LOW QUALITY PROTEIN: sterol regulatory element-binding protein cleavage-activating protein-like [Ptychodera flava]|uniref:LOW QUALITY PROTEIN: sterol regulatory element-binding protein cleavage-activating protein-like n=1 Tax=Ptychodera flava TaxID=63121 RepID=UPI00396A40A8